MSNEFKDKMLQLLTQVDDVKATEPALQTERKLHQDQIAKSEADLKRTENDIEQCRENALALRRQMDDLRMRSLRGLRTRKLSRLMKRTYRLKESTLQKANANVPGRIARGN
jgi:hypothetical protein